MDRINKILVAIRDPRRRSQRALEKAAHLAAKCNAQLELFHALSEPLYDDAQVYAPESLIERENAIREDLLKRLERLAEPLRASGLTVTCIANWDFPAADAIVRESTRSRADLVVVDSRDSHARRWLLRFTDWELLRLSPKPVLLVKSPRAYPTSPRLLVAVDPNHSADKPARLDKAILSATSVLHAHLGGELHVLHAYVPAAVGLRPEQMARPGFAEKLEARTRRKAEAAVRRELKAAGLEDATRHLLGIHPVNAIPERAAKLRADIVIMGAISRSGLRRVLFGNTAEAVLDELHCDVLVVKPAGFARRVSAEVQGPNLRPMLSPSFL